MYESLGIRTRRTIFILVVILMDLISLLVNGMQNESEIKKERWLQNIKVHHVQSTGNKIILEFVNENEGKAPPPSSQMGKNFLVLGASSATPKVEILDYSYFVFQDRKYLTTITKKEREKNKEIVFPPEDRILRIIRSDEFRDFAIFQMELQCATSTYKDVTTHFNLVLNHLKCELVFSNVPAGNNIDIKSIDPFGVSILEKMVINPEDIPIFVQPKPNIEQEYKNLKEFADRINRAFENSAVAKIIVYREGIQTIPCEEMEKAGIDVKRFPIKDLRLLYENKEVPIYIKRGDSKFNFLSPGDVIFFYAPDPLSHKHDYDVYWLLADDNTSSSPLRLKVTNPVSKENVIDMEHGWIEVKEYHPRLYHHFLSAPLIMTHWYWDEIPEGSFREYTTYLYGVDTNTKTCEFKLTLGTIQKNKTQTCNVYINEQFLSKVEWEGWRTYQWIKEIPARYFQEGINKISIEVPEAKDPERYASQVCLIGFEFKYKGRLQTEEDCLVFTPEETGGISKARIRFRLPTNRQPTYAFNVSNPKNPELFLCTMLGGGEQYFYDTIRPNSKYYIINQNGGVIPEIAPVRKKLTLLNSDNSADYLIITHPMFSSVLRPLIKARQDKGLRVFLSEIDDVYDNFSFGCKESKAIKRFIKYVYYKWQSPRLAYVLLVGESSDVHGDPGQYPNNIQRDLVPIYNHEEFNAPVRADTQYAVITGTRIPDVAIGRFSVKEPEEAKVCIEKTLGYENGETNEDGLWRRRIMFVTDDEKEFSNISEYLIGKHIPSEFLPVRVYQRDFDYMNFYRVFQRKKSPSATQALIDELNKGVVLYNYFGHGGPNIWTAERLFHIFEDLALLHNTRRLTFLTASSCDTAWLDYPTAPVSASMGEILVKTPGKGCVAMFAPTTGANPSQHKQLMDCFFKSLFKYGFRDFAKIYLATKLLYGMESGNTSVLDQFVLLGDPYLSFRFDVPEFKELSIEPKIINAHTGSKIKIFGILPTGTWGWAEVYLKDAESKRVVTVEQHLPITGGIIDGEVTIPPGKPGKKYLFIYAYNKYKERHYLEYVDLQAIEPRVELNLSYDVATTFPQVGKNFTVNVEVNNPTELFLQDVRVRLTYGAEEQVIHDKKINLPPKEKWGAKIALQGTSVDVFRLVGTVSLTDEKDSTYYEEEKDIFIPVSSPSGNPAVVFNPHEAKISPFPLVKDQQPLITLPVYNLSGEPKQDLVCEVRDATTLEVFSRENIESISLWSKALVSIKFDKTFPSGEHRLLFIVYPATEIPEEEKEIPEDAFVRLYSLKVKDYADLIVVPDSLKTRSAHFFNGETVHIDAVVKNIGEIEAEDIEVAAYERNPYNYRNLIEPFFSDTKYKTISKLAPGEEKEVSFRWDRFGRPETLPVFVVVNPNKKVKESNYTNNVAETKVTFLSEGNMQIAPEDIALSQHYARRGDRITVTFTVHNSGDIDYNDVKVLCQQLANNKDPLTVGDLITIEHLPANSSVKRTFTWVVAEGYNRISITVNPRERLNEDTYSDNKAEAKINYIVPILDLQKERGSNDEQFVYKIKEPLIMGDRELTIVRPDYTITTAEFLDSKGIRVPVDITHIVNPEVVIMDEDKKNSDRDRRWLLRKELNGWLEASPWEDVRPVKLSIPIPDKSTTFYDVYIVVQTSKDHKGYPASKFKLLLEKEKQFRICDYTNQTKPWFTERYYLGRFNIYDGFLDVTIDDTSGSNWAIINRFDFVPLKGTYTSPVFDLSKAWKRRESLSLIVDTKRLTEESRIDFMCRLSNKESLDEWGEWIPLTFDKNGRSQEIPLTGRYMEWKAILYATDKDKPEINNVLIEFPSLSGGK